MVRRLYENNKKNSETGTCKLNKGVEAMVKAELTNMVMVMNNETGEVLVQDRIKSWKGLSFPGGHVEKGESFVDSAIREIKEETGLDISNLKSCGIMHWVNPKTYEIYVEFLYKTVDFKGELITDTEEGKVYWISPEEILMRKHTNNFDKYLAMFFDEKYNEGFGFWNDDEPITVEYK